MVPMISAKSSCGKLKAVGDFGRAPVLLNIPTKTDSCLSFPSASCRHDQNTVVKRRHNRRVTVNAKLGPCFRNNLKAGIGLMELKVITVDGDTINDLNGALGGRPRIL